MVTVGKYTIHGCYDWPLHFRLMFRFHHRFLGEELLYPEVSVTPLPCQHVKESGTFCVKCHISTKFRYPFILSPGSLTDRWMICYPWFFSVFVQTSPQSRLAFVQQKSSGFARFISRDEIPSGVSCWIPVKKIQPWMSRCISYQTSWFSSHV